MYSITLQNAGGDNVIGSGDKIGRINFAASAESDGGAATYIASYIACEAEGSFSSSSNPAGITFATSSSDSLPATGRLNISSDGNFLPIASGQYDLGSSSFPFRNLYLDGGYVTAPTGVFDVISFNVDNESILTKGQISWDDTEGTMDIGLTDNTTIHIGEHRYFRIRNETGDVLYKGQVVYATGVHSNGLITPAKYVADGSVREVRFMGAILEDVNNQNNGYVVDFGHLQDIDLDGSASNYAVGDETWVAGDILYVHPTVAGKLTKVEPKHSISVAIVLDPGNGNGNGRMFVRPTSYGHLDDNHDVSVSGVTNGQFLQYDSSTEGWVPSSSGNFTTLQVNGTAVPNGVGTIGFVTKWLGNNILGTGVIFDNGTNIGIGKTGPLYAKLHLRSQYTAGTNYNLLVDDSSAIATGVGGGITFGGLYDSYGGYTDFAEIKSFRETDQDNDARSSLIFSNLGSDGLFSSKMIINSSGNVGIGTASPSHKLDVFGVGRFVHADGDCGLIVEDSGGSGVHIGDCAFYGDTYAGIKHSSHTGSEYMMISQGDHTFISASSGSPVIIRGGANNAKCEIRVYDNNDGQNGVVINEGGFDRDTRIEGAGDENLFKVDASADSVGIGTASPATKLHIKSDTNSAYGNLFIEDTTSMAAGVGGSIVFGGAYTTAGATARYGIISAIKENSTSSDSKSAMVFYTNDAVGTTVEERMRITSDGKVGIGAPSPSEKLDIRYPAGGGMALIKDSDSNDGLLFGDMALSANNSYQGIKHVAMTGISDYMMISDGGHTYISSKDGSYTFIRAGGNTTTYQIQVTPTFMAVGATAESMVINSAGVVFNEAGSNRDFRVEGDTDPNLLFTDASTDRVGIGTASPSSKLHVSTNTEYGLNVVQSGVTNSNVGLFQFTGGNVGSTSASSALLRVSSNSNLRPLASFDDTTVITADGSVGIGTASPSEKLDVDGTIRTRTGGIGHEDEGCYIAYPGGGTYNDFSTTQTGYLKITLPVSWTSTMVAFDIDIYEYTTQKIKKFRVGGYNYTPSTQWINTSAMMDSDNDFAKYLVRFGHDGTKCAIYISEKDSNNIDLGSATTWDYCKVSVSNFFGGWANTTTANWADGWEVGFTTTLGTINGGTIEVSRPYRQHDTSYVFNEYGGNVDFRVEGDSDPNLLFTDASTDKVGIGTASPSQKLDIRYPAGGGMALIKDSDSNDGLLFGDMAYSTSNGYQGIKHVGMTGSSDYMMISESINTLVSARSDGSVYIRGGGNFATNEIRIYPDTGGVVVNENGANSDFRVEGDTDQNLIRTDASADRVGIGTPTPSSKLDINADTMRLRTAKTPSSASDTGNTGDICWDSNYVYVCVATNTWKRSPLSTW